MSGLRKKLTMAPPHLTTIENGGGGSHSILSGVDAPVEAVHQAVSAKPHCSEEGRASWEGETDPLHEANLGVDPARGWCHPD